VSEHNVENNRQEGAVAAAVSVFAKHGNFIRSVIRLRVSDPFRREDLYQELFLKLIIQPVPAGVRNVRGYLYRAILNDIIDLAREKENDKRHLQKYLERTRISIHNSPSPSAIIEETEEKVSVFTYLTKLLRRREAQVLVLRYRDNYSIAEIAAAMGVDKRSVSRYLTSGLRQLRRKLAIE
jgi:RNA polymerase sigma-70 factor (ECF subfamily)